MKYLLLMAMMYPLSYDAMATMLTLRPDFQKREYSQQIFSKSEKLGKINSFCDANFLEVFLVPTSSGAAFDYCLSTEPIPQDILEIIQRIGEINRKIAIFLDVPPDFLYQPRIKVALGRHAFGPINSFTLGDYQLVMGIFPDIPLALNYSVYAHELSHNIASKNQIAKFKIMNDFANSWRVVFNELIADLITFVALDQNKFVFPELPPSMNKIRDFKESKTLDGTLGFFQAFDLIHGLDQGCRELNILGQHTTVSKNLCSELDTYIKEEFGEPIYRHKSFEPLVDLATGEVRSIVDDHQIGHAIGSFLFKLSELTKKPLKSLFFDPMFSLGPMADSTVYYTARCKNPVRGETKKVSLRLLIKHIRSLLSRSDKNIFDLLSRTYNIEKALIIDDLQIKEELAKINCML